MRNWQVIYEKKNRALGQCEQWCKPFPNVTFSEQLTGWCALCIANLWARAYCNCFPNFFYLEPLLPRTTFFCEKKIKYRTLIFQNYKYLCCANNLFYDACLKGTSRWSSFSAQKLLKESLKHIWELSIYFKENPKSLPQHHGIFTVWSFLLTKALDSL